MEHSHLQNDAGGFYIFADDATSIGTGLTGLTIAATLSKGGAAAQAVAPTITERADVAAGVYWVLPIAAHRDTLGRVAWGFSAPGAMISPRFEKVVLFNDAEDTPTQVWQEILSGMYIADSAEAYLRELKDGTDRLIALLEDVGGDRFLAHALSAAPTGGAGAEHPLGSNC